MAACFLGEGLPAEAGLISRDPMHAAFADVFVSTGMSSAGKLLIPDSLVGLVACHIHVSMRPPWCGVCCLCCCLQREAS